MPAESLTPEQRFKLLSRLPLFATFSRSELERLAPRFSEISYRKGDVLFHDGDEADLFLVVIRGELEVWGGQDDNELVNRLGPGDHLGEIALLLDNRRTATVTAGRPTTLLALGKQNFQRMTAEYPKLLEYLSQVLSKRLEARTRGEVTRRETMVVGVGGADGKTLVASALAGLLREQLGDRVLVVRLESTNGRRRHAHEARPLNELADASEEELANQVRRPRGGLPLLSVALSADNGARPVADGIGALTGHLTSRFAAVIVDTCSDDRLDPASFAEHCDALVELVARNDDLKPPAYAAHTRVFQVLNLYSNDAHAIPLNSTDPFVLPTDVGLVDRGPTEIADRVVTEPWSPAAPPLRRLARKLLGTSLGIALGGGAAFGIAHVGVLRTLEENGITVDVTAGTSFGSLVALGYAAGLRPSDMEAVAARIGNKRTTLSALDFTPSRPGFLAGRRLKAIFSPVFGSAESFEHLTLPCRTVATDIESGERVMIGDGRLDDAFRASCSVPILWAPVRRGGRTLVDGAIVDPVPADVVREMGADVCIAVNVVPTLQKGVTTVISRASRAINSLNPFSYLNESRLMPNIIDVGMNSLQMLQYELGNFKSLSGDVRLNVDLSRYTWIEFYRALELIERGAEAAETIVPEVKRVLAERLPVAAAAGSPGAVPSPATR